MYARRRRTREPASRSMRRSCPAAKVPSTRRGTPIPGWSSYWSNPRKPDEPQRVEFVPSVGLRRPQMGLVDASIGARTSTPCAPRYRRWSTRPSADLAGLPRPWRQADPVHGLGRSGRAQRSDIVELLREDPAARGLRAALHGAGHVALCRRGRAPPTSRRRRAIPCRRSSDAQHDMAVVLRELGREEAAAAARSSPPSSRVPTHATARAPFSSSGRSASGPRSPDIKAARRRSTRASSADDGLGEGPRAWRHGTSDDALKARYFRAFTEPGAHWYGPPRRGRERPFCRLKSTT